MSFFSWVSCIRLEESSYFSYGTSTRSISAVMLPDDDADDRLLTSSSSRVTPSPVLVLYQFPNSLFGTVHSLVLVRVQYTKVQIQISSISQLL